MATLTVWKFADPSGAEKALETLEGLQKQALIELLDGAVVSWRPTRRSRRPASCIARPERGHSVVRLGTPARSDLLHPAGRCRDRRHDRSPGRFHDGRRYQR